jgi:uroporphyrin-III C-methyltransferase
MNVPSIDFPIFEPGSVWLVGAGPGDPGLLSLIAYHGLCHADCVIYDALVDDRVLALAREGAVLEYAGKRGGHASIDQADISSKLVAYAKSGKRVLRLKGGDPFVFGRGPQECEALLAAGVPFRVVPGVTAGIGGLAYAGIPATSRDTNAAITLITGHTAAGDLPDDVDWISLSKGSPVLVVYMGSRHIARIQEKLREAGRADDELVAVISKASAPDQQVLTTTLGACVSDLAASSLRPPMLIVIGPNVAYAERFAGITR